MLTVLGAGALTGEGAIAAYAAGIEKSMVIITVKAIRMRVFIQYLPFLNNTNKGGFDAFAAHTPWK
ncbi:MAG TPA: hypothetical protein PLG67_06545 [Bacillota bacterium]|nr:hypothetical protein [Bacillota bacterium]HQH66595.1 hypothetical protein [Clostridia bacterium]HQL36236.1 hypothetical protein [Bacillota bacterium]